MQDTTTKPITGQGTSEGPPEQQERSCADDAEAAQGCSDGMGGKAEAGVGKMEQATYGESNSGAAAEPTSDCSDCKDAASAGKKGNDPSSHEQPQSCATAHLGQQCGDTAFGPGQASPGNGGPPSQPCHSFPGPGAPYGQPFPGPGAPYGQPFPGPGAPYGQPFPGPGANPGQPFAGCGTYPGQPFPGPGAPYGQPFPGPGAHPGQAFPGPGMQPGQPHSSCGGQQGAPFPGYGGQASQGGGMPGSHPAYGQGCHECGQPLPGNNTGQCGCGGHGGYPGPAGSVQPKHLENQYGQFFGLVNDMVNGDADPSRLASFLESLDTQFWKGTAVGAVATLFLTSDTVKGMVEGGLSSLFGIFGGGPGKDDASSDE